MRIDVSVPGIRKERGKLPAPRTLGALRLALLLSAGPPICGELVGPALCEPVTGAAVGVPFATEHPVNTEIIKSMTIRPSHEPPAAAKPPSPGVRPRRVARSPRTASHKASRRAPPCGQPACAGQSQRRHGWGELPCMLR